MHYSVYTGCQLVANWLYTGYDAHFAFSLRFWLDSESKQVSWISVSVDCNRFDHLQLHIEFILLLFYCFLSWLWPSSKQPFQRQRDHFVCVCGNVLRYLRATFELYVQQTHRHTLPTFHVWPPWSLTRRWRQWCQNLGWCHPPSPGRNDTEL